MSVPLKPRPASTLALLRNGTEGLEVLMLQRTHQAVFMPGHYVFPGGAVDGEDHDARLQEWVTGHDEHSADRLLEVASGGLGYLVAAVRECFEESGVLLACDADQRLPGVDHPALVRRDDVASGALSLLSLCREYDLRLALEGLACLDHWITPPGPPRRFDTRFFVAEAPAGQYPRHDGEETIDSLWIRPQQALADDRSGRRDFAHPTRAVLERLQAFETVSAALAGACGGSSQPLSDRVGTVPCTT